MNRRSFFGVVGCLVVAVPFGVKSIPQAGSRVRLVRYVDSSLVGGKYTFIGAIATPQNANEHYRDGEQLYRVQADGLSLDVYADEISAI